MRKTLTFLLFLTQLNLFFAQEKIPLVFPNDTVILFDRSDFIPRYTFEINPYIKIYDGKTVNKGIFGFFLKSKIQLNENINTNFELNTKINKSFVLNENEYLQNSPLKIKQDLINNFLISFECNLGKKIKSKKSFYLKRFYDSTKKKYFKPKVLFNRFNCLKLNVGIRKSVALNRLIQTSNFVHEDHDPYNSSPLVYDYHFDNSEEKFDFDGFLNEIKTIKYINNYSLNIGFTSSFNNNYNFSLNKQRVKRNHKSELYLNFIFGLFRTYKYDNRILNPKIEDDFKGRVDYKRMGCNLGYQIAIWSKNNQSGFNINLEIGTTPELLYNSNFLYDVANIPIWDDYNAMYSSNEIYYKRFNTKRYISLQFGLGYTFGQKIKSSK